MRKKNQPRILNLDDFLAKVSQIIRVGQFETGSVYLAIAEGFPPLARLDYSRKINQDSCPLYWKVPQF